MPAYRRRRSCLAVPGGSEKMQRKAVDLAADEIVFDLEDAVVASDKDAARRLVVGVLSSDAFAGRTVAVRINDPGTQWGRDDLAALGAFGRPELSLVVPKVESATMLALIQRLLADSGAAPIAMQALIETAAGLANVNAIAAGPNLETLIIGYADLASSLGRTAELPWTYAQEAVLVAARANGLQAIDGPHFAVPADASLDRDAKLAAGLGYDGKWAIHPSQIGPIHAAFTPSAEAVVKARAIVQRLDEIQRGGSGAGLSDGAMIDEAMRAGAERVLARAANA